MHWKSEISNTHVKKAYWSEMSPLFHFPQGLPNLLSIYVFHSFTSSSAAWTVLDTNAGKFHLHNGVFLLTTLRVSTFPEDQLLVYHIISAFKGWLAIFSLSNSEIKLSPFQGPSCISHGFYDFRNATHWNSALQILNYRDCFDSFPVASLLTI